MKHYLRPIATIALIGAVTIASVSYAQRDKKKPDASQGASVIQVIGIDDSVAINYHRPGVKGRDVWGGQSDNERIGRLVPFNEDPRPWRAGANEATTITFTSDVKVEGKALAAGTYALFFAPTEGDWTVIFSKKANQWGSFRYNAEDDALRVTVTPTEAPHQEWLVYGFDDPMAESTVAYLHWEKVKVSFKIEL